MRATQEPQSFVNRYRGAVFQLCALFALTIACSDEASEVQNSTGGQAWVTSDRWGPLQGQLLNFSFGQSSMMLVLREQVDGLWQGGVVPMRVGFASGAHRARFRPQDGQLYVVGTKGWVSNATRDGSLQRVRYTGAKVHLPVEMHAVGGGLRLRFLEPLDREIAQDGDSWAAEQWNYVYSKEYGSKEWSAVQSNVEGHDAVEIKAVRLSDDGRGVVLEIPALRSLANDIERQGRGQSGHRVEQEVQPLLSRDSPHEEQRVLSARPSRREYLRCHGHRCDHRGWRRYDRLRLVREPARHGGDGA